MAEPSRSLRYQYCRRTTAARAALCPVRNGQNQDRYLYIRAVRLSYVLEDEAEADIVVAIRRPVVVADGGTAILRRVVPAAAAIHPVVALWHLTYSFKSTDLRKLFEDA